MQCTAGEWWRINGGALPILSGESSVKRSRAKAAAGCGRGGPLRQASGRVSPERGMSLRASGPKTATVLPAARGAAEGRWCPHGLRCGWVVRAKCCGLDWPNPLNYRRLVAWAQSSFAAAHRCPFTLWVGVTGVQLSLLKKELKAQIR